MIKKTSLKECPEFPALTTYTNEELYKFISAIINWKNDFEQTVVNMLSDFEFDEGKHAEVIESLQTLLGEK